MSKSERFSLTLKDPLAFFLNVPVYPKFYWHDGQKKTHCMAFGKKKSLNS